MASNGRIPVDSVWCATAASMTTPKSIDTGATQSSSYPNTAPAKTEAASVPPPSVIALWRYPGPA